MTGYPTWASVAGREYDRLLDAAARPGRRAVAGVDAGRRPTRQARILVRDSWG